MFWNRTFWNQTFWNLAIWNLTFCGCTNNTPYDDVENKVFCTFIKCAQKRLPMKCLWKSKANNTDKLMHFKQRGLKYTERKSSGRHYLGVTCTTMSFVVRTLTQVKARTGNTTIFEYNYCWSYRFSSQLKYSSKPMPPAWVFRHPASQSGTIAIQYRTGVHLFRYRTGVHLFRYRTVRHSGIWKNCTKVQILKVDQLGSVRCSIAQKVQHIRKGTA